MYLYYLDDIGYHIKVIRGLLFQYYTNTSILINLWNDFVNFVKVYLWVGFSPLAQVKEHKPSEIQMQDSFKKELQTCILKSCWNICCQLSQRKRIFISFDDRMTGHTKNKKQNLSSLTLSPSRLTKAIRSSSKHKGRSILHNVQTNVFIQSEYFFYWTNI